MNLVQNLWENNLIEDYLPYNIKGLINKLNPSLKNENDIKKLTIFIIETLHKELNEIKISNKYILNFHYENIDKCFQTYERYFQENFKSIISNLFAIKYNTQIECLICKHTTNKINFSYLLSFSLIDVALKRNNNNLTINNFFSYFQKSETTVNPCSYCKTKRLSYNNFNLLTGPKVLIINIEREKNYKLNIKLNFDETLNLNDFIYYNNINYNYQLIGVITKINNKSFIAICRSFKNNNWYKYNGSIVTKSSFREIKKSEIPYLLFYSLNEND